MEFTESVRSFHVPATPVTTACPPSFPSVPTSRATRVTSGEGVQLIHHRIDHASSADEFALQSAAFYFKRHSLREIAVRDGADHARDFRGRLYEIRNQT